MGHNENGAGGGSFDLDYLTELAVAATGLEDIVALGAALRDGLDLDYFTYNVLCSDYHKLTYNEGNRMPAPVPELREYLHPPSSLDADPAIMQLLASLKPQHWFDGERNPGLTDWAKDIFAILRNAGYVDGLTFPVSTGPGDLAFIAMSARGKVFNLSAVDIERLRIACDVLHRQCTRILGKEEQHRVRLSQREVETMNFVIEGCSNKEIADRLKLSTHTIDMYLRRIFQKLNVRNRVQAAVKYTLLSTWNAIA